MRRFFGAARDTVDRRQNVRPENVVGAHRDDADFVRAENLFEFFVRGQTGVVLDEPDIDGAFKLDAQRVITRDEGDRHGPRDNRQPPPKDELNQLFDEHAANQIRTGVD
ncbi:MAG: hypothetical protein M5R36_25645 [Deltaproteobacteria bacterium]|nr:hypothetical protein [Deltaproteobacteria bacterium]